MAESFIPVGSTVRHRGGGCDIQRTVLFLAVLLAAPALAGCFNIGGGPNVDAGPPVDLPRPRTGARYLYDGPGKARLQVDILPGTKTRLDGRLVPHEVQIIEWSYRREKGGAMFKQWEAIDGSTGHVVQQVARCIPRDRAMPGQTNPPCFDERASVHLGGAAGLPGAFGAAPLWNRTVRGPTVEVPLHLQGATRGPDAMTYRTAPVEGWSDCLRLTGTANVTRIRALAFAVARGPFVICPDHALPVAFTTYLGDRYRLVDKRSGDAPIPEKSGSWPTSDDPGAVPLRPWKPPVAVDRTDGAPYGFPFREAHRWAMDNHSRYREIVEDPLGFVAGNWPKDGPGAQEAGGVVWKENSTRRRLTAIWPNGSGIRVTLQKTWREDLDPTTPDEEWIEVVKTENKSWPAEVGNLSTFARRQADAEAAFDLARQVTGNGISGVGIHQSPWFRESMATSRGPFGPPRSDGYTVVAWMAEDPPYPGAQGGGMVLRTPYEFVVDGPTGALEWLQVNRTRLPVINQVRGGG